MSWMSCAWACCCSSAQPELLCGGDLPCLELCVQLLRLLQLLLLLGGRGVRPLYRRRDCCPSPAGAPTWLLLLLLLLLVVLLKLPPRLVPLVAAAATRCCCGCIVRVCVSGASSVSSAPGRG